MWNLGLVAQEGQQILLTPRNSAVWGTWDITYYYTKVNDTEPVDPSTIDYNLVVGSKVKHPTLRNNGKSVYMQVFEGNVDAEGKVVLFDNTTTYDLVTWDGYIQMDNVYKHFNTDAISANRDMYLRQTNEDGIFLQGKKETFANKAYRVTVTFTEGG